MKHIYTCLSFLFLGFALHCQAQIPSPQAGSGSAVLGITGGTTVEEFTSKSAAGQVMLHWVTSEETGLREFIVRRTTDWVNFTEVGAVSAKGSGSKREYYDFCDATPVNGFVYYCLYFKDIEDQLIFAGYLETNIMEKPCLNIWPNPASTDNLQIEMAFLTDEALDWSIVDSRGQVIVQQEKIAVTNGRATIYPTAVAPLKVGNYFLQVSGIENRFSHQFSIHN